MLGLALGWDRVHYHIWTHPQKQCGVPSSIRKLLSRSQKLLIDPNSKCQRQQNFTVQFICVVGNYRIPFSLEKGESHTKATDEGDQPLLNLSRSSAPEILMCSSFFSFLKVSKMPTERGTDLPYLGSACLLGGHDSLMSLTFCVA